MQETEQESPVAEASAESVAHGHVDGETEAYAEEAARDEGPGGAGDDRNKAQDHEALADTKKAGAAGFLAECVDKSSREDKAEGLADEDEGDDTIADVVVSMSSC